MSRLALVALSVSLTSCSSGYGTTESTICQLTSTQKQIVIENLNEVIDTESTETVTYELSPGFLESGKLMNIRLSHDPEPTQGISECWASLMPRSRVPGISILDGDGGVYIDMQTLEPGYIFWFSY